MTNIATFPCAHQDPVSLHVEPGSPDVLSLLTTNIPLVHARLTELRQRVDHPRNRPRQIWVDLSNCHNFAEVRGDILVRALRLTQFLPAGFIGEGDQIEQMARAAHLPRVSSRQLLPRAQAPRSNTVPRIEIEQAEDITVDLRRRLAATQEENTSNSRRAEVLSQALGVVREQRDRLEAEIRDLNTRMSSMSGQLEWASVQHQSAEAEVASVVERLGLAMSEQQDASSRASALEEGMALVEEALVSSRHEAWELQNRLAEMEQGGLATAEQVDTLSRSLHEFELANAQMSLDLAQREADFSRQREEFAATNEKFSIQAQELHDALAVAREEASRERSNALVLIQSRDEVEKQAALTSKMLDDALSRVDELSAEAASASQSVAQFQGQWQTASREYQHARDQLLLAQEEARQANADVVSLSAKCQEQDEEIKSLRQAGDTSIAQLGAAKVRAEGLSSALEAAQSRADEIQSSLDQALAECEKLREQISGFEGAARQRESDVVALMEARDNAIAVASKLNQEQVLLNDKLASVAQDLVAARAETARAQDALLEASHEVVQVQAALDETRRVNEVVNEIAGRQANELYAAREEMAGLNAQVQLWCERMERAKGEHACEIEERNSRIIELTANLDRATERARHADALENQVGVSRASIEELSSRVDELTRDLDDANCQNREAQQSMSGLEQSLAASQLLLDQQASKAAQDAADFGRRLSVSRAENESLSRRLASAKEDLTLSTEQLEGVISDLRSQIDVQTQFGEKLVLQLEDARRECRELALQVEASSSVRAHLESTVSDLSNQVRSLESVVVEQEAQIERSAHELEDEKKTSAQLRDHLSAREDAISRQQEQMEASRHALARSTSDLGGERQAHAKTRDELSKAIDEVQDLTGTVHAQASAIVRITSDLSDLRETCSLQSDELSAAMQRLEEANSAARAERRSRASLEVELVEIQEAVAQSTAKIVPSSVASPGAMRHDVRVRSGQRVSSPADLIVSTTVSPCAELLAKGSVHIYGAMHGRVHAGCEGDRSARIYCMQFNAEQVAIAGRMVVFEAIPAELAGRPVEVWLDEATDVMQVRPLNTP